jgi:ribosomal protein L7/L12
MNLLDSCRCCGKPVSVEAQVCPQCGQPAPGSRFAQAIEDHLRRGETIQAIKFVRAETGLGLAEAKALVERFGPRST